MACILLKGWIKNYQLSMVQGFLLQILKIVDNCTSYKKGGNVIKGLKTIGTASFM